MSHDAKADAADADADADACWLPTPPSGRISAGERDEDPSNIDEIQRSMLSPVSVGNGSAPSRHLSSHERLAHLAVVGASAPSHCTGADEAGPSGRWPSHCTGADEARPSNRSVNWRLFQRKVVFMSRDELPRGEKVFLDLEEPPSFSFVAVRRSLLSGTRPLRARGSVSCFDPNGLMVFTGGCDGVDRMDYFICDWRDRSVTRLPAVSAVLLPRPSKSCLGVISSGGRDGYLVAQLHPELRRMLTFNSVSCGWGVQPICATSDVSVLRPQIVFPHRTRLCFVDLKRGILLIDPFCQGAIAPFTALPNINTSSMDSDAPHIMVGQHRCVTPGIGGSLCFVVLTGVAGDPAASVYLFLDADDEAGRWIKLYTLALNKIWSAPMCDSARILLVHPRNAHRLYLCVGNTVQEIDSDGKVHCSREIDCVAYTSLDVWAWQPPISRVNTDQVLLRSWKLFRKLLNKGTQYVIQHPEMFTRAGNFVQKKSQDYIPDQWSLARTGFKYMGKAISYAGDAIKHQQANDSWQAGIEAPSKKIFELKTVESKSEAMELLEEWKSDETILDDIRVVFPKNMSTDETAILRDLFVQYEATALLNEAELKKKDDGFVILEE